MTASRFRLRIAAEELTVRRPADRPGRIARALRRAAIDLNPHQIEASVRGLQALSGRGVVLADEVGLGKTIEAGLILAQLFAEGRGRLLVLTPASLRLQWANELEEKLGLRCTVVEGNFERREQRQGRRRYTVFDREGEITIASHGFAARRADELRAIRWDCVVIDEAHRLRGAHRGSKTAVALRDALEGRPKLLLTATPLQNGLSELYGILSFLDRDVFGPFDEFRRAYPGELSQSDLKNLRTRVQPLLHRTLRRQVREYVRYTDRTSMVFPFTPSEDESRLYDEVSNYLADKNTLAIKPNRRALMVLVYRKLLASSPQAIATSLARLANSLQNRIDTGDHDDDTDIDETELITAVREDMENEPTGDPRDQPPRATPAALCGEADRLRELAALAESIRRPAKTNALMAALDRAFTEAASRGWPQKAVVFTESRRTQDALFEALEDGGYPGDVLLLNGSSGGAEARANIVESFRNDRSILILTEAGAEGLNLQFANLVVNYDLPWNPQRIEQRIGRCHRYGQTRDVVVLNFLASDNAADARLYELLEKKLQLFDGVFGATDEALGAMGDGASFERRVVDIFVNARDEAAISSAFDALQADISDRIGATMARAREMLCDNFDDQVRARLKMTGQATEQALDKDERALVDLVTGGHPGAFVDSQGKLQMPGGEVLQTSHRAPAKGQGFLTVDHPAAKEVIDDLRTDASSEVRYVELRYTAGGHKISKLVPLLGSEGWWLVYRVSFDGPLSEDHLVHVVLTKTADDKVVILEEDRIQALLDVQSRDIPRRSRMRAATLASTHAEATLEPRVAAVTGDGRRRALAAVEEARENAELWFEDRLRGLQAATGIAEGRWKKARSRRDADDTRRLFRDLERALRAEHEGRQSALAQRRTRLQEIEQQRDLQTTRTLVQTAYFWLD